MKLKCLQTDFFETQNVELLWTSQYDLFIYLFTEFAPLMRYKKYISDRFLSSSPIDHAFELTLSFEFAEFVVTGQIKQIIKIHLNIL